MKYKSITTPNIDHDAANAITELILLNKDINIQEYPWRTSHKTFWGKTVSAIRKLIRDFNITEDQLAFFIFKCAPQEISGEEFAKAAVVAKKLLQKYDLSQLMELYRNRRAKSKVSSIEISEYSYIKPKSLLTLLKELENGEGKTE